MSRSSRALDILQQGGQPLPPPDPDGMTKVTLGLVNSPSTALDRIVLMFKTWFKDRGEEVEIGALYQSRNKDNEAYIAIEVQHTEPSDRMRRPVSLSSRSSVEDPGTVELFDVFRERVLFIADCIASSPQESLRLAERLQEFIFLGTESLKAEGVDALSWLSNTLQQPIVQGANTSYRRRVMFECIVSRTYTQANPSISSLSVDVETRSS